MKNRIEVNKAFIEKSLEMANDLLYLVSIQRGNTELKRDFRKHINNCKKYINKMEE